MPETTVESGTEPEVLKCLQAHSGQCRGNVEYREALTETRQRFPRCDGHWEDRLTLQNRLLDLYPATAPVDFDPLYAGERWDEDDW